MTDNSSPPNNALLALNRDLGRLEGRLSAVEREQMALKADITAALAKLDAKVDALTTVVTSDRAAVKGGWMATTTIAGLTRAIVAAAIGALAYLGVHFSVGH